MVCLKRQICNRLPLSSFFLCIKINRSTHIVGQYYKWYILNFQKFNSCSWFEWEMMIYRILYKLFNFPKTWITSDTFADNLESLQTLIRRITEINQYYSLGLDTKKTKYMVISKHPIIKRQLTINQLPNERVERYTYLGI